MSALVEYNLSDGVARIALNRPEVSNAVDLATAELFAEMVACAGEDDHVRAVLLMGNGRRFCAGGDLASIASIASASLEYVRRLATVFDHGLRGLAGMPKPVVVAVQGAAAGAGLGAVLSADLAVASRSAVFTSAYTSMGLTPDCGVSWLLPRAVGQPRALQLALTRRSLSAEEALSWGIVAEVVDDDHVVARAEELALELAAGPVTAFGQAKRLIRTSWQASTEKIALDEADTIGELSVGTEARELIKKSISR